MKKIIFFILFPVVFIACSKDDSDDNMDDRIEMVCSSIQEINEVTVTNVSITAVNSDTLYGYTIKATITNNTDERLEGEPIFQFSFSTDVPLTVSGPGICGDLLPNVVCNYEKDIIKERGEALDTNPTIHCFGYTLE